MKLTVEVPSDFTITKIHDSLPYKLTRGKHPFEVGDRINILNDLFVILRKNMPKAEPSFRQDNEVAAANDCMELPNSTAKREPCIAPALLKDPVPPAFEFDQYSISARQFLLCVLKSFENGTSLADFTAHANKYQLSDEFKFKDLIQFSQIGITQTSVFSKVLLKKQ